MKIIDNIKDKLIGAIAGAVMQKSSWGKLFEIGHENKLFGDTVTSPYSQITSVYQAVKAIADNVPQADVAFYNYTNDERDYDSPQAKDLIQLFDNPNPLMTGKDFIQTIAGFYALYNECFIIKANKDDSRLTVGQMAGTQLPQELWVFNPTKFKPIKEADKLIGWRYDSKTDYSLAEVIHFIDFNPSSMITAVRPTKPIEKLIDINWQALIYNKAFFDNFARVGLTLTTEKNLNEDQYKRLRGWLDKEYKGANKAFKTAIFEGGLTPHANDVNHKDMDFIGQLRFAREETLGIWRVPKALFNITDDLNYATFQGQMKIFWLYALQPILSKIEGALNTRLVTTYDKRLYFKFDTSQVPAFKEDFKNNIAIAKDLFGMGVPFNKINERLQLGFEPLPHGEVSFLPFSLTPADQLLMPPEEPEAEEPTDQEEEDEDDKKSVSKSNKTAHFKIWKAYLRRHTPIERRLQNSVKSHFYEQRKMVLSLINEKGITKKQLNINWNEEREKFKKKVRPHVALAANEGAKFGKEKLGVMVDEDILATRLTGVVAQRTGSFDNIQRTVEKQLNVVVSGLERGQTIQEISDGIKRVYNMAANRSLAIARTETGCAINSGSFAYYEQVGKETGASMTKTWITAGDESVRPSHAMLNGDSVPISASFDNGLKFPNDPDGAADDIINCRCTYITDMKG
jgi:HK97 family phage portal protein